jgi:hypothetical protein
MLVLVCSGGEQWVVPDPLIERSAFLKDLVRVNDGSRVPLPFSFEAAVQLMKWFASTNLPDPTPLETLAEARSLVNYLQLSVPEPLERFHMLLAMETIRSSGAANPYDASACMLLSVDLEMEFPDLYVRLGNQTAYENLYWNCVRGNVNPKERLTAIIGPDGYAIVQRCAEFLRAKYRR